MSHLDGYDEMFLDLLSLMNRVERTMGAKGEPYNSLDTARVEMIERAPAGWSVADVMAERGSDG